MFRKLVVQAAFVQKLNPTFCSNYGVGCKDNKINGHNGELVYRSLNYGL